MVKIFKSPRRIINIILFIIVIILPIPLKYFSILDLTQTGIVYVVLIVLYSSVVQLILGKIFDGSPKNININTVKITKANLEKELKDNYQVLLLLENWTKSIFFEGLWNDILEKTKELKFVYYDMYKNSLNSEFGEKESQIIDTYERLKLLQSKVKDSIESLKDERKDAYSYSNQSKAGKIRKEICELIKEQEKCLLLINKQNEEYYVSLKKTYCCNI